MRHQTSIENYGSFIQMFRNQILSNETGHLSVDVRIPHCRDFYGMAKLKQVIQQYE